MQPRNFWTVPSHLPFLDALVAGLFDRYGNDPLGVSALTILLPTRRACRNLQDAFLRASEGTPILLPRIAAAGDLDADELELSAPIGAEDALALPPTIEPLRRQLLLARLILGQPDADGTVRRLPAQAMALARELARFLDEVQSEGASLDRLDGLVPADLAKHWQVTLDFLAIIREHWPSILAEMGLIDPAERRNRLIACQIARWRSAPPTAPVIAAGFGAALPSIADLLATVAELPQGAVVLPALDHHANDDLWQTILEDPTHPQQGMAVLLDRLGVDRSEVRDWRPEAAVPRAAARAVLCRELMRPAAHSHEWQKLSRLPDGATDGMTRLDLAGPVEEATTIALLLREQLELPGATAMLVTSDRGLGRRVATELARWGVQIDDSAGTPLNQTPPGVFLRLVAEAAAEQLAPVPLLALLKHPLAAAGLEPAEFRRKVRHFERQCLRGPRPASGLEGLRAVAGKDCRALLERLEWALGDFVAVIGGPEIGLADAVRAHVIAAERLAAGPEESGAERLWALDAGEALAGFVAELLGGAGSLPSFRGDGYPALLETAMAGRVVRPRWGKHPRIQILGVIEARLQSADLVILGGLNEGSWPPEAAADPWMSRPMRRAFGLPPADARIGTSAHDFLMGLSAPEVVLTRALRAEGAPTVPARWLLRLDTVLRAVRLFELPIGGRGYHAFRDYQELLDRPVVALGPIAAPEPRPPLAARPSKLSVTEIETWMRDPYAIYARHVLKLHELEAIDADPGAAERGKFIHQALDAFVRAHPTALPDDAQAVLEAMGREAFGAALARPGVWAFWWPRFERIVRWFLEQEIERRPSIEHSTGEIRGRLDVGSAAFRLQLTARADRVDRFVDGGTALIDYKTGRVPGREEVSLGFSPQLPLEAAIAAAGGFEGVPAAPVTELAYWRLTGGNPVGAVCPLEDPARLADSALTGLEHLVETFADPETPYRAQPNPAFGPRYSRYGHLARVQEWGGDPD